MPLWRTVYDRAARVHGHALADGFGHALMVALQCYAFHALRVSAAVWRRGTDWFPIYHEPNIGEFELELGVEKERDKYNDELLHRAWRSRSLQRGEHAGFSDLFVPIVARKETAGILVVGPFARTAPSADDIRERWQSLARRPGHVTDPEFASYLNATLSVVTLPGAKAAHFERMVDCIARLMSGSGRADALANEAARLCAGLERERFPERMWESVRTMIDDRYTRTWQSAYRAPELSWLGLSHLADHILVGLMQSRSSAPDPVQDALVRDGFQRATVELARTKGDLVAGQVGHRGVVFLCAGSGSPRRRSQHLMDLSQRVAAMARERFGLTLYFGASAAIGSAPLSRSYRAALGAAESAFSQGAPYVHADPEHQDGASLWQLRQRLSLASQERPGLLPARFELYLDAVTRYCGDQMQPARAHLEIGFERMTEALVSGGLLEEKSLVTMREDLGRTADAAQKTPDLVSAFRSAVAQISEALDRPVAARQERSLKRAVEYVREHYTEPLRLESVARIAGFAPGYFSRLFLKRERTSFAGYVLGMRIERAKQLLSSTELDAARIGTMCGFGTPQYFSAAFRRETRLTPGAWRAKARTPPNAPLVKKRKHKVRKA
jgi:AraC-like DNA-binding protein